MITETSAVHVLDARIPATVGWLARLAVRMPSTVVALSRTSDTRPVARVAYHRTGRAHCLTSVP